MAYGSGKPAWARGGDVEDGIPNRRSNANSGNSNGSYQRGGGESGGGQQQYGYQPPQVTGTYAEQQGRAIARLCARQGQGHAAGQGRGS